MRPLPHLHAIPHLLILQMCEDTHGGHSALYVSMCVAYTHNHVSVFFMRSDGLTGINLQ